MEPSKLSFQYTLSTWMLHLYIHDYIYDLRLMEQHLQEYIQDIRFYSPSNIPCLRECFTSTYTTIYDLRLMEQHIFLVTKYKLIVEFIIG